MEDSANNIILAANAISMHVAKLGDAVKISPAKF